MLRCSRSDSSRNAGGTDVRLKLRPAGDTISRCPNNSPNPDEQLAKTKGLHYQRPGTGPRHSGEVGRCLAGPSPMDGPLRGPNPKESWTEHTSGQRWSVELARIRPSPGHGLPEIGPTKIKRGPKSGQSWRKLGRARPKLSRSRRTRSWTKLDPKRPQLGVESATLLTNMLGRCRQRMDLSLLQRALRCRAWTEISRRPMLATQMALEVPTRPRSNVGWAAKIDSQKRGLLSKSRLLAPIFAPKLGSSRFGPARKKPTDEALAKCGASRNWVETSTEFAQIDLSVGQTR